MSYISKKTEDVLFNIVEWTKREDVNKLICADENALEMFADFEAALINLKRARKRDNEKTWAIIKERRKTNKNYCR